MAKRRERKGPSIDDELELDMTPMIDVTFLLISFFMVVGVIASNEIEALYLPAAEVPPDNQPDPDRFILNILRDGQVVYRGDACDPERLKKYLMLEARKDPSFKGSKGQFSKQKILVRADQDALYDFVQLVMIKCTDAKIINLQFGVKEKKK